MRKIIGTIRRFLGFRYRLFTELMIILFIFLLTFPLSIVFRDLLNIPQVIFIPIFLIFVFTFTRFINERIKQVEGLFLKLRRIRYLMDFIALLMIFYAFVIIFFGFLYFMIAKFDGYTYSYYQWIYFSMISLTTVGYGDIAPINDTMKLVASIEAFIGYISPPIIISIGLTLVFNESEGNEKNK